MDTKTATHLQVADGATPLLANLWTERTNARLERWLWLSVLQAQIDVGVPTPPDAFAKYWHWQTYIDLDWVEARERITRHDIKARIEHFNDLAGYEVIHRGLTSHDVVDNVNLWKIKRSLQVLARTWSRPAIRAAADSMLLRGLRGPVGTAQDLIDLMGYDGLLLAEARLRKMMGFSSQYESIGQIYPRSADLVWVDALIGDLVWMGAPTRTPWFGVLVGFAHMMRAVTDQWNEGDVSASVTRRVAVPGCLLAADHAYRQLDNETRG